MRASLAWWLFPVGPPLCAILAYRAARERWHWAAGLVLTVCSGTITWGLLLVTFASLGHDAALFPLLATLLISIGTRLALSFKLESLPDRPLFSPLAFPFRLQAVFALILVAELLFFLVVLGVGFRLGLRWTLPFSAGLALVTFVIYRFCRVPGGRKDGQRE